MRSTSVLSACRSTVASPTAQARATARAISATNHRSSVKSICTSVAFPAFVLGHDPTRRIICVSYAEGLARKHANDCRAIMRTALYNRLFPDTRISVAKDTELEFATTLGGNRLSTSVGGTLTGRGGNLIIIDDPLKPQDAYSEASARKHQAVVREHTAQPAWTTRSTTPSSWSCSACIPDDLVGHLLEQDGWTHLNLPAIAETEHQIPIGPGRFGICVSHGDVLHPEREPRAMSR